MASLTDQLPEPNFTPQAIGGARKASVLEGLAEGASGILRAAGSAMGNSKKSTTADDDPLLDEYAMKVFETKSGLKLGDPGYDNIAYAKKLQKAKENGTLDAVMYDIKQQGNVADLMRKDPSKAREIMADAYNLHGVKDNLFREAAWADAQAKGALDRNIAAKNTALDAAVKAGLYDPRIHSEDQGISMGLDVMETQTFLAAQKAKAEADSAAWKAGDEKATLRIKQSQEAYTRRFMQTAEATVLVSMETMQMLMSSAGSDVERNQALDIEFQKLQQGIMLLGQSGRAFQSSFETSFVDDNGTTRVFGFDDGLRTQWDTWLQNQQNMVTNMMNMDLDSRKRFIQRFTDTAKIEATKQMPTLMAMKDSIFGGSFAAAMDFIANGSETLGVDPAVIDQLRQSAASGLEGYVNTSLQSIKEMTIAGALPSSNPNAKVAEAAFQTNTNLATVYGAQLRNGKFANAEGQRTTVEGFRDSFEDTLYAVRANYTPNAIDLDKATRGMKVMFNNQTLQNIDAFVKMGGAQEDADQFYTHAGIAAVTFVDGLKSRYGIEYNKALGRFIPNDATPSINNVVEGFPGAVGGEFSYTPARDNSEEAKKAAMYANSLLSFVEAVDQRKAVIDPTLLKEGEMTLKDVIGSKEGLAEGIKILAKRANDKMKEGSDAAFAKAVADFTDERPGSNFIGGMNVNPFTDPSTAIDTASAGAGDMMERLLTREGGFVKDDNGAGPTNFGINAKANPDVDVENLTKEEARAIYSQRYLAPIIQEGVPDYAMEAVFDTAVNQGVKTALDLWKASKGDLNRFVELRMNKYNGTKVKDELQEAQVRASWKKRAYESAGLKEPN